MSSQKRELVKRSKAPATEADSSRVRREAAARMPYGLTWRGMWCGAGVEIGGAPSEALRTLSSRPGCSQSDTT